MIEQVISEIIAAEEAAEKIRSDAEKQAADIVADAQKRATDTANATAARVKARKIKRNAEALAKADSAYETITGTARKNAEELLNSCEAASEKAGDELYRRIINGDC